jgi:hypothetical protein
MHLIFLTCAVDVKQILLFNFPTAFSWEADTPLHYDNEIDFRRNTAINRQPRGLLF